MYFNGGFLILCSILVGVRGGVVRVRRNAENGRLSRDDEERLARLYGREVVEGHRNDFIAVGQREPPPHPIHPPQFPTPDLRTEMDEVRLLQHQALTPSVVKTLLRELLERLEAQETGGLAHHGQSTQMQQMTEETRCSLHGIWLSAITGVAFQLGPSLENNVLRVQVSDAGGSLGPQHERIIGSDWTGTAQVAATPTTMSIILQERMEGPRQPKTAVFVGQCVVCNGTPRIQGTWILFSEAQTCFQETQTPKTDVMYLLAR